ncbi:Uncharacterized protein FWK35_00025371, partial [Aphis craccivora]
EITRCLSKKSFLFFTYLSYIILRLSYLPILREFLNTVLVPKLDKQLYLSYSYWRITLLLFLAKLLGRLILKRLLLYTFINKILPDLQFNFYSVHRTVHHIS